MGFFKDMSFWILLCATLSVMSYFADYLLTPESRRKHRDKVQIFFRKIFDSIDRTNFFDLQTLMVEYVIKFKNKLFGKRIVTRRMFIISLLCSQYLTLTALILSSLVEHGKISNFNFLSLVPFFPFIGFSFLHGKAINIYILLEQVGLFWNNYLFDFLAITSTVILLKMAYERKLWFSISASIDIFLSYLLSYLCILFYFFMPPRSGYMNISFFTFIPDIWNDSVPFLFNPTVWLFYSLTTFVPILFYLSVLLFFSLCKFLQYVCAPLAEKCSEVGGRTIFFTFGSAFAILLVLLTAIKEFIN